MGMMHTPDAENPSAAIGMSSITWVVGTIASRGKIDKRLT
jgi:hypothetical protein